MNAPISQNSTSSRLSVPASARPVRLIVCGEVSSGKSGVINALLRKNVAPDFFGEESRPMISVRHGSKPRAAVHFASGDTRIVQDLNECEDLSESQLCEIVTNAPHLDRIELIEIPIGHDGEIEDEAYQAIESGDILIWVTIASQAWRLSEKTTVSNLPKALQDRAILVVSRGDKLKSDRDRERIGERLNREAGDIFKEIVFMSAASRMIEQSTECGDAWEATSGKVLTDIVLAIAAEARSESEKSGAPIHLDVPLADDDCEIIDFATQTAREPENSQDDTETVASRDHDSPALTDIREMVSVMNGVIVAGIADTKDGSCVANLFGDDGIVESTCQVTQECLIGQKDAYGFGGADPNLDQTQISMNEHFLLYQPSKSGASVMFVLCKTEKIIPAIARNALRRMCRVWDMRD